MDPHTWPCKSWTTSTNIHSATMWGYRKLSRRPAWGYERLGKVARAGQGYPCSQHSIMMMMMMMMMMICIKMDSALNNQQCLIYHKAKPNQTKPFTKKIILIICYSISLKCILDNLKTANQILFSLSQNRFSSIWTYPIFRKRLKSGDCSTVITTNSYVD